MSGEKIDPNAPPPSADQLRKKLVDEQIAKGISIEEHPVKRAISSQPVVKPIKVTAPNSVFALGNAFTK